MPYYIMFPSSQPQLEKAGEEDVSLATNLERQLLYTARPSLIDAKPVSFYINSLRAAVVMNRLFVGGTLCWLILILS